MDPTNPSKLEAPIRHFCGAHQEITGGLRQLQQLPELARALEQARAMAAATLKLFDEVVLQHHAEEEQELFVSVRRSCRDAHKSHRVDQLVERLTAEHRHIERSWARVRPALVLVAAGKAHRNPALADEVASLVQDYAGHARLEEQEFLPLAADILGRDANHMAALDVSLHLRRAPAPAAYI